MVKVLHPCVGVVRTPPFYEPHWTTHAPIENGFSNQVMLLAPVVDMTTMTSGGLKLIRSVIAAAAELSLDFLSNKIQVQKIFP